LCEEIGTNDAALTEISTGRQRRDGLRDASGSVDAEWAVAETHLTSRASCGPPYESVLCTVLHAILSIAWAVGRAAAQFAAVHHAAVLFPPNGAQETLPGAEPHVADTRAQGGWTMRQTRPPA